MAQVQTNDAAGGSGSLTQSLLGIALNGLSRTVDGALSKRYPLTSFNETETYDVYGNPLPSSAPQTGVKATQKAVGFFQQPIVIGISVAVAVSLGLILILRRR